MQLARRRLSIGGFTMKALGMLTARTGFSRGTPGSSRKLLAAATAIALVAALGSCGTYQNYNDYDPAGNASKKDYESLLGRTVPEPQPRGDEPPIPGFQSVLAAPSAPELADTRRVSIAVTETTPVRDILIELTRKAQVDLELDPRISGGIIMTATDKPFLEVIERIVDLAELRFTFERNSLRVELDDPYLEQYRMDILNVSRTATSSASSSSDASSIAQAIGVGGGAAIGGSNQSTTTVNSTTSANFWGTIGAQIDQILVGITSRRGAAATTAGLNATFVPEAQAPAATPAAGPARPGGSGNNLASNSLNAAAALSSNGLQNQINANVAADQPGGGGAGGAGAAPAPQALAVGTGGAAGGAGQIAQSRVSLNPQAGIITLFANKRQHSAVARYLRDVRDALNQQVLIEAKVVEVTLSDQYRAGVDWNAVFGPNNPAKQLNIETNFSRNVVPPEFTGPTLAANWANGALGQRDLSLAVQLVKEFGTVRTLSSPRLTVLNNQMAQLKVAQNQVFFQLQVNVTDATAQTAARTTVTSQIKTIPIGLIMSVMPSVDPVSKRISLSLRPSITRITGYINDPGVAVTIAVAQNNNAGGSVPSVTSPIPIVEAREMDSLISMESGQTVVMGGLMQDQSNNIREGLPGVMDVPLVGQALSENIKQNKVTELVVFIRATLANAPGTVADEDIRLYKTFAPDPRPVGF
jgi:MSHA biogenesis protein MshL